MKYYSTKKFGPITTGHRQWKDSGHCKYIHGYARYVEITFACHDLNDKQWVMDFGGLKHIKKWLDDQWDHRLLISNDDPLLSDFEKLHEKGIKQVRTDNEENNPMYKINVSLGFTPEPYCYDYQREI